MILKVSSYIEIITSFHSPFTNCRTCVNPSDKSACNASIRPSLIRDGWCVSAFTTTGILNFLNKEKCCRLGKKSLFFFHAFVFISTIQPFSAIK